MYTIIITIIITFLLTRLYSVWPQQYTYINEEAGIEIMHAGTTPYRTRTAAWVAGTVTIGGGKVVVS